MPPMRDDPDDATTWVVSTDGVGPIALDAPFEDLAGVLVSIGWSRGCGENAPVADAQVLFENTPSRQLAVASGYDDAGQPRTTVSFISISGEADETPRTSEGIGIGSKMSDVPLAYADAEPATFGQGFQGYRIVGPAGAMYFGARDSDLVQSIEVTNQPQPALEFCG